VDNQFGKHDDTRCRYCGGKLSLLQRLGRHEFCSPEHRQAFQREQEELALARLQMALDPEAPKPQRVQPPPVPDEDTFLPPLPDPVDQPKAQVFEPPPAPVVAAARPAVEESVPGFGSLIVVPPPPVADQVPCQDEAAQISEKPGITAFPSLNFGAPARAWAPAGGSSDLHALVRPAAGDLLTIFVLPPAEEVRQPGCRLPELGIERSGWKQIAERERERRSEPPMAGLVPIKGPQTLRVVIGPQKPEAEPEYPVALPNTAVSMRATARTAGPRMGGVRALRTRIGTAGSIKPISGGSDEPIEAHGDIAPALPRLTGAGLAGGALGKERDKSLGKGSGETLHSVGTGAASGAGGGDTASGEGAGSAAGTGSTGLGDLRMDGSQIPVAGYCSLGGGPLDRESGPRACEPFLPPYDLAGVRALLSEPFYLRMVELEQPPARGPEDRPDLVAAAAAGEEPPSTAPAMPRVAAHPGRDSAGALPSGTVIPGYRLINQISARLPAPRHRAVVHGSPDRIAPPQPRPASVSLPLPRLQGASCQIGFDERPGALHPLIEDSTLEPSVSGAPRVWRASGAKAPAPQLGYGWLEALDLDPADGGPGVRSGEFSSPSLDANNVQAVKPVRHSTVGAASVPAFGVWLVWPARPKDLLAEPDLQAIGCSFASGGGLWDSLT
jgi:hypothetical protein